MRNTLYISSEETKLFNVLPANLREGWTTETTKVVPEDDRAIAVRIRMADMSSLPLGRAGKELAEAKSPEDFDRVAKLVDFRSLSVQQMAELFFMLGVKTMSGFIGYLLIAATKDEDLEAVAALSQVRKLLSETNSQPVR